MRILWGGACRSQKRASASREGGGRSKCKEGTAREAGTESLLRNRKNLDWQGEDILRTRATNAERDLTATKGSKVGAPSLARGYTKTKSDRNSREKETVLGVFEGSVRGRVNELCPGSRGGKAK